MVVFLLFMTAVLITGGGIAGQAAYFGIPIVYMVLGALLVSYTYLIVTKREELCIGSAEKVLIAFEAWGLIYVILSFLGINRLFQADLIYDYSFIPRQAVYFFVLPAAILFRERIYLKGMEWLLKKYGEILFWTLYFAQMLFFQSFAITVLAQVLLCWLSLALDTNQRWRRWIRIIALLLTPMFDGGHTTILIIRMIFAVICIVPKCWQRIVCYLIAVAILLMIISCFFLPSVLKGMVITDFNSAWRLRTWKDSETVLEKTNYLGIGYGTSYQSEEYIRGTIERDEWQYREGNGYTAQERKFVTAPHNSYISVTMRTGIVGIVLFVLFLIILFHNLVKYRALPSKASCFALFAATSMITFNVGLESPGYLLTFVFCIGICMREGKKLKDQNRLLQEKCETS